MQSILIRNPSLPNYLGTFLSCEEHNIHVVSLKYEGPSELVLKGVYSE